MAFSKSCKYAKGKVYNFFLGNLWSLFGPLWTPKKVHFGVLNRSLSRSATDKSEPNTWDICQCTQKSKRFVSTGRAQVCSRRDEMHTFLWELKDVWSGLQVFLLFRDRVIFGVHEDAEKLELPFWSLFGSKMDPERIHFGNISENLFPTSISNDFGFLLDSVLGSPAASKVSISLRTSFKNQKNDAFQKNIL